MEKSFKKRWRYGEWFIFGAMKARLSQLAETILQNPQAADALVDVIMNNSQQLHNGETIIFKTFFHEGGKKVEKYIAVKRSTALDT